MVNGEANFWDQSIWSFVTVLAVLFGAMIVMNALRRNLPFLRKSLIPSSVLAGFGVLIAGAVWKRLTGKPMLSTTTLEALTYHGLGLGFVALSLRSTEKQKGRQARRDIFNTSTVVVSTYLLQGIVGLALTLALFYAIKSFAAAGMLLPMGYGQGPGQAYTWGKNFSDLGFENGISYGLSVAACGFISASAGGVIYLGRIRRKKNVRRVENAEEIERLTAETITAPGEIPLSESVDKLTVQFALVFIAYGIAYLLMYLVHTLCSGIKFYDNTVRPLMWGFNFLVGTAVAIGLKSVLNLLMRKNIMKRAYTNNFMLNRISGTMFDLMVAASIAAIDLGAFSHKEFVLPLTLTCAVGAAATYLYCKWTCARLFGSYEDEAFLALYGMLTGTASTGVILLREIDPSFETPASSNLVYQNLWSIIMGFPMLLLMGYVAKSLAWSWATLGIMLMLEALMLALMFRGKLKQLFGKGVSKQEGK
ncbi:MAG: hypothetical protein IKR85_02555 [Clostridia bacterium]|nr:hypothetical protein [Clostridia bacterium]